MTTARRPHPIPLLVAYGLLLAAALLLVLVPRRLPAQTSLPEAVLAQRRAHHFAAARTLPSGAPAAAALSQARAASSRLRPRSSPTLNGLSAAWTPAGPAAIQSLQYGFVSGRVTALALDPADPSGNTVVVGTTGGGLWRSTNAAGPAASVTFSALTDTLPVFSPSAGYTATASLSIGALAALPGGVLLAGTGDPNDSSDSYYGSGLLRSTDSGLTWSLIQGSNDGAYGFHSFLGLGFSAFASSTTTPSLVVAALSQSAEGAIVHAGNAVSVMGLYYSTDSGATWRMSTLLDGAQTLQSPSLTLNLPGNAVTSVVWNPLRQLFFAAVRYHGYYSSPDGITWTRLTAQPGTALSLASCPTGSGNVSSSACPLFRGTLAVNPATGDTFTLTTDSTNHDLGLFQDLCASTNGTSCAAPAPTFARQLASAPLEAGNGSTVIPQADYNATLAAIPSPGAPGSTLLFVGTADLFRCTVSSTTACTLRNTTNTGNGCTTPALVAPAQHAFVSTGGTAPVLFLGNDGGLWRSTDTVNQQASPCSQDDQTHFQNLNLALGSLAEVVSFAQDPADPSILLAGLGALGAVSTGRSGQTAWQQLSSGEGGTVAIDPTNPAQWYVSTAAGIAVSACPLGSACTATTLSPAVGFAQVGNDPALLDAPWLLDPANTAALVAGTCRVWRGPAASPGLWSAANTLSPLLSGPQNASCPATSSFLASLAAGGPAATGLSSTGSTVLYAGMAGTLAGGNATAGGHLFATTVANLASSSTAWTDLAASPVTNDLAANAGLFNPAQFTVSSVTADPHDPTGRTVYATVQGFSGNGLSVPHLYGSTDAGAHWLNLSANLPNAPANALVVDPNDSNTVYIALDSGVYVTTGITTCPTSNCWSLFGTALPNSPVTTLAAAAGMPTPDGRLGLLRAGTYGRGLWQIPLLTAATIQRPAATLSITAITFAAQSVGTASAAQAVLVTNTGAAPLNIARIAIASNNAATGTQTSVTDFALSADACTSTQLAVGASCSFAVSFSPSATGARSSTLTVFSNVPGGQSTVSLAGTATTPPALLITPTSLTFAATNLLSTAAAQTISVSNTGGTTLTLSLPQLSGADFALSANTCGTTLAPSTACALSVTFRPSVTGARTGSLTLSATSGNQTLAQSATLAGTGIAPPTDSLSVTALTFAAITVGTASPAQQLILTNAGDSALTLIGASIVSADFAVTNTCGNSLAGHSACALTVIYTPHAVGSSAATLLVTDAYRTQTIALAGTAIAPPGISLLPAGTLTYPATGVGTASPAQALTLTNNGGQTLLISSITPTGDFVFSAAGSTCGVTLAPATACTIAIVFVPTAAGARSGSLAVVSNSPTSPQTVLLTGTGVDFSLNLNGATGQLTLASGAFSTVPLLVTSPAGLSGTAALACTGLPANTTCTVSPSTVPLGGSTPVTVTISTGVATTHAALQTISTLVLATLLPLGLLLLRRRDATLPRLLALIVAVTGLGTLAGCGGTPRQIPGDSPSTTTPTAAPAVTPSGTYTLSVTATAAGLTRSTPITLTVQ